MQSESRPPAIAKMMSDFKTLCLHRISKLPLDPNLLCRELFDL